MPVSSDRLDKLKQQQAALAAKIRREQQRLKSTERKADTRRKVILGALVLKAMESDTQLALKVSKLLATLKREDERALFDLTPLLNPDPLATSGSETKPATPDAGSPAPAQTAQANPANQDDIPQPKHSLLGSFSNKKK